jgi:hypothetical protein
MFETNVINEIDLRKDEAEMDVLFAICESYSKMINIVNEVDDESIIQESYTSLFMEAVDNETSNFSIKDFVLGLLGKIFEALKSIMVKIIDVITKRIFRRRETYNALVNSLILLDCFQHVNVKSVVQESGLCEIEFDGIYAEFNNDDIGDNEVIQEKWTPMDEMRYRKAEKNIANAKKEQSGELAAEQLYKGLQKFYKVELRHRVMSKKELADIVKCVCMTATPSAINELKEQINNFEKNDTIQKISDEANRHREFIINEVDKKNQAKWKEICDVRRAQCKTIEQADMELKAMESLIDNFGKSVSNLTNQRVTGSKVAVMDTLTTGAGKAAYRGFLDLADVLWSTVKQIPTVLNTLKQNITLTMPIREAAKQVKSNVDNALTNTGSDLREGYEKFQSTYHEEKDKLNAMGQKATKMIATLKFFGDGLGEETIIANQDNINSDVFRPENIKNGVDVSRIIGKLIYGGHITFTMKILAMLSPGYVMWASTVALGVGGVQATVAAGTAIAENAGAMAAGIVSTATIANVFKTLTGTVIRGYGVRKLTGDMDAKTPTMIHDEQR